MTAFECLRHFTSVLFVFTFWPAASAVAEDSPADAVFLDAHVLTMDPELPEATAFAIRDGRFVAVGSNELVSKWISSGTEVFRANQRTIVPGFNDAHIHPSPLFDEMSPLGKVDCNPDAVQSIDGLVQRLKEKAARTPDGQWVRGSRYQDTKLGRHLNRADLDRVSTTQPVYVSHSSGHLAAVNSFALEMAGVDASTVDPKGGSFGRSKDGEPDGLLCESAKSVVLNAGPDPIVPTSAQWMEGMIRRFEVYASDGITSVQHAGISPATLDKYRLLQATNQMVRVYAMLRHKYLDELVRIINKEGRGNDWLRIGGIKDFHGNSLSGRTCWLYEPYADRPDYFGIPPAASQDRLNDKVSAIHKAGLQACIHANGDREIDMVLDAYQAALATHPNADHRHRIEHASVCNEKILKRVKDLGVVLATHSYIWEHGDKMDAYGESRWNWMHPNGSAVRMGIPVAGNSDSPVSAAQPLLRIQSMVTRASAEGKVYGENQKVTVEDAIRAWTAGSAYASFDDQNKGTISRGKLADFVILSEDPRSVAPQKIKDIRVLRTVVGGRTTFPIVDGANHSGLELARGQRLVGRLSRGPATENSGIVQSRTNPDVFWMHNDSGDEPRIYGVRRDGTAYRGVRYSETPGTLIGGAINVDWEDITAMPNGTLIVADVGNNRNDRRDLVLYFVNEPSIKAGRTTYLKKVFLRYPDQKTYPAAKDHFNFDCEAVFTIGERVHLMTKHRSDTATHVYRLNSNRPGEVHELEFLQSFPIEGQVVAADALPDGSRILVATYDTIWLFDVKDQNLPLSTPMKRLKYKAEQVEAVTFDGPERVLFADEATALLYEADISDFEEYFEKQ